MTKEEHTLIVLMFARMNEALGAITDTLKSRNLWTADDEKAFHYAVHSDLEKLALYTGEAFLTYLRVAKDLGVETGLKSGPTPEQPGSA